MRPITIVLAVALSSAAAAASAQQLKTIPIGHFARIADNSPATWAIAGMRIVKVNRSYQGLTPVSRTFAWDARTVEILSRTQSPPLTQSDVRVVTSGGHTWVAVRRYLLIDVTRADASTVGMTVGELAARWAHSVARALVQIAPMPNRFGV